MNDAFAVEVFQRQQQLSHHRARLLFAVLLQRRDSIQQFTTSDSEEGSRVDDLMTKRLLETIEE